MQDSFDTFESKHVRPVVGRTLIVGSKVYAGRVDRRKLYADCVGVDMLDGEGVDLLCNLESPIPEDLGTFDHIECLSVLEHSKNPWALARNLEMLLNRGGSLFVSAPFAWRIHGYPNDYWRFTPEGLRLLFPSIKWSALEIAADRLLSGPKVSTIKDGGFPYIARSQVVGFGHK